MNLRVFCAVAGMLALGFAAVCISAGGASAGYRPVERYYGPDDAPAVKSKRGVTRRGHAHAGGVVDYVYAESWHGFKKVIAPVRHARLGYQVRLPGGTWVYCEFSCEYTLRKQSLDFWEGQGSSGFTSPGLLRKDFYLDDLGRPYRRY